MGKYLIEDLNHKVREIDGECMIGTTDTTFFVCGRIGTNKIIDMIETMIDTILEHDVRDDTSPNVIGLLIYARWLDRQFRIMEDDELRKMSKVDPDLVSTIGDLIDIAHERYHHMID